MENTTHFTQFREKLYRSLVKRADSGLELLDALCSQPNARSVVELSLSPHFQRTHTALYKAIDEAGWEDVPTLDLIGDTLRQEKLRPYWRLGLDGTPQRRQYAYTLGDRGYVYSPNPVAGNKPVTIGHEYSTVAFLPEKREGQSPSWVVPLSVRRVATSEDKELVGAAQINALLDDEAAPWAGELVVVVGDSRYSKPEYLHAVHQDHPNLVSIVRLRSNRTLYRYLETPESTPHHRPKHKGDAFKLPDAKTHDQPCETITFQRQGRRGQTIQVQVEAWSDMLMPGKNKPVRIPMEKYPFRLVRITLLDEQGKSTFTNPVWVIVVGNRRHELTLQQIAEDYLARSNLEHFFRFGKQKLLMDGFQTPETAREEKWWHIAHLAYTMLWLARPLAQHLPRPWERHLPQSKQKLISPAIVQRDFSRLISQVGSCTRAPKPRGKPPGHREGTVLPRRERISVVYKGQNQPSNA
jgi:hypothetical protein